MMVGGGVVADCCGYPTPGDDDLFSSKFNIEINLCCNFVAFRRKNAVVCL